MGGELLEIGAAYGFSLNMARDYFERVAGVEINKDACDYSRKRFDLELHHGDFLKIEFQENEFDAVVSWATFEHLQTPHLYIEKISRLLKKGGIFALTTVDIDGMIPRLRKSKWRQIHPPSHVSYFSRKTLTLLLERYGFRIKFCKYLGNHRSMDNVLYGIMALIYKKPHFYNFAKRIGLTRGSFYLNLYDLIYVVAEKH